MKTLAEKHRTWERAQIVKALRSAPARKGGVNMSAVARRLGVHRTTVYRMCREHGIDITRRER